MTSVASTGSATGASLVVNGLISGITTPEVIDALLQSYTTPITDLEEKQDTLKSEAADYRAIATDLQAVQTAAEALDTTSKWDLATATTSDSSVATATASAGAQTGSLTFTVTQLAEANVLASAEGVSSEGELVTAASTMLVATGAAALGFSALTAGAGLAVGSTGISVTQASAAATVTGSRLATTVHVAATATLDLTVNGAAATITLAGGTYTASELATAVTTAATTAGIAVQASVAATGGLELSTDRQGAAATLAVTGGSALGTTGITAGRSGIGADATVTVGGTETTLSSITPGQVVTLGAAGSATITATIAAAPGPTGSLVSAGTAQADNVSVGNGSLSDVVSAINGSGLAVTASAVQLSSGDYILQVAAGTTGTKGAVSIGASAFATSALGQLRTISAAQDAQISVGGVTGYTLSSATDSFTGLLSGTAITVASAGTATVTVSADATGEASKVATLVTAANKALSDITTLTGYTATSKTGGPLMGDAVIAGIRDQILSIFSSVAGSSTLGDAANVGITLGATGTGALSFTKNAFVQAFETDPTAVEDLFVQGGTYTPSATATSGDVAFGFASTLTASGTYTVAVSHSATQALDIGSTLATGTVPAGETLTVTMGSTSAAYTIGAGASLSSVADGLNVAFAGAGLSLTAEVATGTRLSIVSDDYGSSASFTVTATATAVPATGSGAVTTITGLANAATFAGTDVAGTINGVAATGSGQVLEIPTTGGAGAGLGLVVTAAGITTGTTPAIALGSFTYRPGIAQQLATAMGDATNAQTGSITTAQKALTTQATNLNSQISTYEKLESEQRAVLQQEFDTMETNLGKLENESSELESELASVTTT